VKFASRARSRIFLAFSKAMLMLAALLDSLSIPWHGKSSSEPGSVMI
jgi:hypothetical protein